ncbi:hypothetical protein NP493_332g03018 [Ridgeia piscesae]|uniref:Helicase ATP-binding domain-containing protein n=1 Tax=Ridgeia piscesae TaxID=27915 RepID=A0AAD9NWB4_RIDPI|nr:hypothetical protein NP493_332g03018 [Ridgeia piscesae]
MTLGSTMKKADRREEWRDRELVARSSVALQRSTRLRDRPIVLCAPTGSGKTVIFELAIIRLLFQQAGPPTTSCKIVYMAPMKALCAERYEDWTSRFTPVGLKCMELTGDTEMDDYFDLQDVHIILTTPEKWDSMTRRWRDNRSLVQSVKLFLIDECRISGHTATPAVSFQQLQPCDFHKYATFDQSLYAIAKQIQWKWPEMYGKDKFVVMFCTNHRDGCSEDRGDWLKHWYKRRSQQQALLTPCIQHMLLAPDVPTM